MRGFSSVKPIWDDGCFSSLDDGEDLRTAYSASRLRGSRRSREASLTAARMADLDSLDPHVMVIPEPYALPDAPLEARLADPGAQPFAVEVHPDVAFVTDFHAHLADSEIIGLLGGYWDRDNRIMYIQAPFPCRSTEREDDGATDVEMDPASEISIREIIASHGMQVECTLVLVRW